MRYYTVRIRGSRNWSMSWGSQHIIRCILWMEGICLNFYKTRGNLQRTLTVNFRAIFFLKISWWRNNLATLMALDWRISQSHFAFCLAIWSRYACHLITKSSNENGPFNELHTMHNCCKTLTSFMQMILWRSLISFSRNINFSKPKKKNILLQGNGLELVLTMIKLHSVTINQVQHKRAWFKMKSILLILLPMVTTN